MSAHVILFQITKRNPKFIHFACRKFNHMCWMILKSWIYWHECRGQSFLFYLILNISNIQKPPDMHYDTALLIKVYVLKWMIESIKSWKLWPRKHFEQISYAWTERWVMLTWAGKIYLQYLQYCFLFCLRWTHFFGWKKPFHFFKPNHFASSISAKLLINWISSK